MPEDIRLTYSLKISLMRSDENWSLEFARKSLWVEIEVAQTQRNLLFNFYNIIFRLSLKRLERFSHGLNIDLNSCFYNFHRKIRETNCKL